MDTLDTAGGSGCASTDAHLRLTTAAASTLLEVARRRREELPGLLEALQDDVLVTIGGTSRRVLGWFAQDAWLYRGRRVHEVFLNGDRRQAQASTAEDVLVTLLHEACHVWAHANGIKDVSRGGRYHNREFAKAAALIGLTVDHDPIIGYVTPGLSSSGHELYADILPVLDHELVLSREPHLRAASSPGLPGGDLQTTSPTDKQAGEPSSSSRYVFATCACVDKRDRSITIRVARGSWRPLAICCAVCQMSFDETRSKPSARSTDVESRPPVAGDGAGRERHLTRMSSGNAGSRRR